MEGELATLLVRGVVGTVIAGLGFAVRGLFARARQLESEVAALKARPLPNDEAGRAAAAALQQLKLDIAERYIRRDDYVTQMAGVATKLDSIGVMVARLDERFRLQEGAEHAP